MLKRLLSGTAPVPGFFMAPDGEQGGGSNGEGEGEAGEAGKSGEGGDGSGTEGDGDGSGEGADSAGGSAEESKAAKPWEAKRIATLTRNWREEERKRQAAESRIAELEAAALQPTSATVATVASSPDMIPRSMLQSEAQRIATEQLAAQAFNDKSEAVVATGRKDYGADDFNKAVKDLQEVAGDAPGNNPAYMTMLTAALETGEGARIIFELGQDQNKAFEMLQLPPHKLIMEITKMALAKPKKGESGAPAPHKPLSGGKGRVSDDLADDDDVETWMKKREKQLAGR